MDSAKYNELIEDGYMPSSSTKEKREYGPMIDNGTTPIDERDGIEVTTETTYITDEAGNETEEVHYYYREYTTVTACTMYKNETTQGAWSAWSKDKKQRTSDMEQETRTVYRYKEK